jgi:hypothetical protein
MEAVILVLVLHCGVPEAIVRDTPEDLRVIPIPVALRERVLEDFKRLEAAGAQTGIVRVEEATGEKCGVST